MIYYTKSNIYQKLHKKKKKKTLCSEWPGNRPAGRPIPARPTRAPRALPFLCTRSLTSGSRSSGPPLLSHCGTLTGRSHPSAPSLSRTAARPRLRPPLARVLAHAHVCTSTASPSRTCCYHSIVLYLPLPTSTAQMAGGRVGCPKTGHEGSVERKQMEQGASGRVKEHGAHVTTTGEAVEELGDGGRAVGRVLRLRRARSGNPVRVQSERASA